MHLVGDVLQHPGARACSHDRCVRIITRRITLHTNGRFNIAQNRSISFSAVFKLCLNCLKNGISCIFWAARFISLPSRSVTDSNSSYVRFTRQHRHARNKHANTTTSVRCTLQLEARNRRVNNSFAVPITAPVNCKRPPSFATADKAWYDQTNSAAWTTRCSRTKMFGRSRYRFQSDF